MTQIILIILLSFFSLMIIIFDPFIKRLHATTLWAGKRISPTGLGSIGIELPRGIQDSITPRIQNILNIIITILSPILVVIFGTLIEFYLGITCLVVCYFLTNLTGKLWSIKLNYYLNLTIISLENRRADFLKQRDLERANAATDVLDDLKNLFLKYGSQNLTVPDLKDIRRMSLGD